ncbi:MAG: hypothetical protein M3Y24_05510 [Acidobacteriota bacterium]|nr:hypothetical protein [Acidobacteriota bacterium]
MKQAIHIFKKDVSHLRYDIGITLLAAVAFCFMGMQQMPVSGTGATGNRIAFFLPVTWFFLIARVIHADAIPGERQFWLTRPYQWKSLLGAKLLFILVFVNLPLLIADAVIIHAAGFSISQEIAGLLWTQVLLITAFVLPIAAFSAITSGLLQLLSATFLLFIVIQALIITSSSRHSDSYWMELEWVKTYCLMTQIAAAAAIILLWQYARRNTFATRIVAGAAAVALVGSSAFLPWTTAFALQTRLSTRTIAPTSIRIELDSDRKWLGHIYDAEQNQVVAELPLQISGIPAGMELEPNGLTLTLHAPDGETWIVNQTPPSSFDFEASITSLRAVMTKAFFTKVKNQPLQLRGSLFFTLYGNKQSTAIPLNSGPVPVNGLGLCSAAAHFLLCNSVFRTQPDLVSVRIFQGAPSEPIGTTEHPLRLRSYSPFPADLNIDPLYQFFSPKTDTISGADVEALEPLAYLRRDFEIDQIRLNDFVARARLTATK